MPAEFCSHCMQPLSPGDSFCPRCGRDVSQQRSAPHQLPIGAVLRTPQGHTYLFGQALGEGGFGITYIARELSSGQVVAIKEYFPGRCQPQRSRDLAVVPAAVMEEIYRKGMQSFLSEASMLRAVRDLPSIVHVLDCFEANHTAYMVMEYLNGTTLKDLMQSQNRLEPDSLLRKALPLMRDLERLHSAGVLHRDIAPDNIMLMPDGSLTLLDFGCARSMEDGKSMTVVLKPGFAPIEQYQTHGQSAFTDLYALCATLYYCLTGKVPPAAPERLNAVFNRRRDPLPAPSALGAAITQDQEQLLLWGLEIQPTARPQRMEELADRLEETLPVRSVRPLRVAGAESPAAETAGEHQPPAAQNPSAVPSFWRRYGVGLLLAAACGVILLLLALLLLQ